VNIKSQILIVLFQILFVSNKPHTRLPVQVDSRYYSEQFPVFQSFGLISGITVCNKIEFLVFYIFTCCLMQLFFLPVSMLASFQFLKVILHKTSFLTCKTREIFWWRQIFISYRLCFRQVSLYWGILKY